MLSDFLVEVVKGILAQSLNPCSNGICSLTDDEKEELYDEIVVLILVLMEYAL